MIGRFCLCIIFALNRIPFGLSSKWSYDTKDQHGPTHWEGDCEHGHSQSPIDFKRLEMEKKSMDPFKLEHYSISPAVMELENNGHTIKMIPTPYAEEATPAISGGGLGRRYSLAQLHFHWGASDSKGSEHLKGGVSYPMEMHMLHYDNAFHDIQEAIQYIMSDNHTRIEAFIDEEQDILAVISVLFSLQLTDNPDLDRLLEGFERVLDTGNHTAVKTFPLDYLLPYDLSRFYRYNGSLTTPGCQETVIWTIFHETVPLSKEQMARFRIFHQDNGQPIGDNFRPPQPVGKRKVYDVTTYSESELAHGGVVALYSQPLRHILLLLLLPVLILHLRHSSYI